MLLQSFNPKLADDEPQLEGAEAFAERDLPVHVVDGEARVLVLEVQRLDVEGTVQCVAVLHPSRAREKEIRPLMLKRSKLFPSIGHSPHGSAVEVHHHPLAGVEGDGVRELDARQPAPELGADEGGAGVGRVHVQPKVLLLT